MYSVHVFDNQVFQYARSLVRNDGDADDVTQEALIGSVDNPIGFLGHFKFSIYTQHTDFVMQSSKQFLGRATEVKQLSDAWSQAKLGNPQWVAIVAETGVGKTRLVQEFYRQLAAAENASRMPAVGYWPDELPIDRDKLGLNPDINSFSGGAIQSIAELPWLWWGLRGQWDIRNANGSGCAARDAKANLELHYAAVITKKMKESAARRVGTEAVKVVSNVLGFGAVETFFSLFDPGSAAYEAVRALCTSNEVVLRAEKSKQSKKLEDQLTEVLAAFLDQQIPIILVLDDAQWLDVDTVAFVSRLVMTQVPKKMKLMIVSTCWASGWHAAPIRDVYESFSESKSVIPLAVVDSETAKTFLLSKFAGLTGDDVTFILDRAEGNFLYLEEISIELSGDRWTYFVDEDPLKNLSALGISEIKSNKLNIEKLILKRFLKMVRQCQVALMQSSYQGRRFDPQLTARVGQMVLGSVEGDPDKTLEALKLADKPGAMITEVEVYLREFLQGPYHRLIREKFDQSKDETSVRSSYQQLIINGTVGVADSIVEAVLVQWLEEMSDEADRIPLLARLLVIATNGNRYQVGLGRLKQLASAFANLPGGADAVTPTVDPGTSYAAVRLFGQYAFGAGDQADRQLLEEFCLDRASKDLQRPIFAFLHDGTIPTGCALRQLVTWCEALVRLRQALGHIHDYFLWLGLLCQLKNRLL